MPSPWWYCNVRKHCLHVLAWNKQQEQISVPPAALTEVLLAHACLNHVARVIRIPPAAIISVSSAACKNSHTRCNFLYLLHGFSKLCLMWTLKVKTVVPGQHMFWDAHQLSCNNYFITHCKLFPLSFIHTAPFAMKLCSVHNIILLQNRYAIHN